MIIVTRD